MRKFYFCILFPAALFLPEAQELKTVWQKDFASSTQDLLSNLTFTPDRQMLLSGSKINTDRSFTAGAVNKGYDYYVTKLNQQGAALWTKSFGGSRHDYLVSSVATKEGGFLLAGTSYSGRSGDKKEDNIGGADVWIIRLDENGEELWQKTLGTRGNDEAAAAVQAMDEGFFIGGNIHSNRELFGSKDVFISKTDKNGKLLKTIVLGGTGTDELTDMIATPDGGVILTLYSTSSTTEDKVCSIQNGQKTSYSLRINENPTTAQNLLSAGKKQISNNTPETTTETVLLTGKSSENFGAGDYWIVKIDKDSNIEWQNAYGGEADDRPKAIVFTESGYIVAGESRSAASGNKKEISKEGTDIWVVAVDKSGNELWQKSYSFGQRDAVMSLDAIRKINDKNELVTRGFLIGGYTQAEQRAKADDEKFWMLYFNTDGKEEWRKHVEGKSRKNEERLIAAKWQKDGTYLLAGTSADKLGEENWKLVKLGGKELSDLALNLGLRVYPNPVEDYCYVEIGFDFQGEAEILITDMSGRLIQELKTKNKVTKISTAGLPQGVYIVTVKTAEKMSNGKIVKK